jgi:dTDP-4-dehydrorhamnose 3,5-epimerase
MIDGVVVTRPPVFRDERGSVLRMLRTDDAAFAGFGEVYFSTVNPGVVKGWKLHREMTMTLAVPIGRVLLVLFDDRADSPTRGQVQEIAMGPEAYQTVTVPPMVWNGFMGLAEAPSLVCNCASILHRPDESDKRDIGDPTIPYRWPTL